MSASTLDRNLRGVGSGSLMTGEGVLIELPPASLAGRAASRIIDQFVYLAGLIGTFFLLANVLDGLNDAEIGIIVICTIVLWLLVIPMAVEVLTHGRSLGKLATKLRVVRDDGGPITTRHAFVRALLGVIEFQVFSGLPAVLAGMFSTKVKRLGDMAAGTYAVREETAMKLMRPPAMPPPLAHWAAGADIGSLPDDLVLAIRQFLVRRTPLTPAVAQTMATGLANQALAHVSPPPPAGAPPDAVLAAILARHRDRESERLRRDAWIRQRALGG